jgi:hypothetical protein
MRQLISILTLFFVAQTAFAYNPFWVHIDKKLIKSVVQLDRKNPQAVEQYFRTQKIQRCDTAKENLGFGWSMWTPGIGGGYIGISATFFYYHDSIVSYTINPRMPDEKGLIKKYKTLYQDSFSFESDKILPFIYNSDNILRQLKEYNGILTPQTVPRKILEYMTPNSGTMYGYAGGYGGHLLQNRKAFIEIKDSLTNDQVIFLMYSINPASRLTAIEYYLKYKNSFSNQQTLDEWIEINFKEIPTVQTLFGCIGQSYDTRALVQMYSSMETDK